LLLTARRILLIHFLMRLPDFVKPAVAAADRFVQRIQREVKIFQGVSCLAVARRPVSFRHPCTPRGRYRTPQRLPRSETPEG
jgi:hypothetical protein